MYVCRSMYHLSSISRYKYDSWVTEKVKYENCVSLFCTLAITKRYQIGILTFFGLTTCLTESLIKLPYCRIVFFEFFFVFWLFLVF